MAIASAIEDEKRGWQNRNAEDTCETEEEYSVRRRLEIAGQLALAYKVFRCWVSEYQALPELDANTSAVAFETIRLENEGWERDNTVPEPAEPVLSE
jgi:phage tail-like protein